jgi:hypothetical protein
MPAIPDAGLRDGSFGVEVHPSSNCIVAFRNALKVSADERFGCQLAARDSLRGLSCA